MRISLSRIKERQSFYTDDDDDDNLFIRADDARFLITL